MVAFGMVGASISGVTFVSVPGMVLTSQMAYLQVCLGFIVGYVVVAFLLLPLYYRLNLTSIYTYLGQRLGRRSYLSGAWFFLLSKMTGAAAKFYVVCLILQHFVFDALGLPFAVNAVMMVLLIWLYTHRGGIKTLVVTDSLQTLCLLTALLRDPFGLGLGPRRAGCSRQSHEPHICLRRLGFTPQLLETVPQRSLYRDCHDGPGPGHDAEEPNVP